MCPWRLGWPRRACHFSFGDGMCRLRRPLATERAAAFSPPLPTPALRWAVRAHPGLLSSSGPFRLLSVYPLDGLLAHAQASGCGCVPSAVCTLVKDVVTPVPVVLAFTVSIDLYVFDISLPLKSVIFRPTFYLQAANLYFL